MAGLLSIAACQPLPQPFQPADKDANALLWPGARTGIVVKEIAGAPAPRALAGEMARALRETDVVASGHDTCADEDRFFSYRRSVLRGEEGYGRGLSAIALVP